MGFDIPAPLPSDASDVADALDVARALLEKGQIDEAIRWVRRAVEAADESGDAARVAALARTAAELADHSSIQATPTPTQPVVVPEARSTPRSIPSAPRVASVAPPLPTKPPSLSPSPPSVAPPIPSRPPVTITAKPSDLKGRLRVSVRTSARDPSLFVVRPLPDGAPLPPGTRLAFLEMSDVDVEQLPDVTDSIEVESSR